ncbi:hypothetical protein [Vibrio parahaemolyticus]|uniref:hypothetical protein n=1 Tax=Vibrio parahaemolyticus TaxID=670 RepID=UPI0011230F7D|nr:hypothetical protein [Vibrio parahaemolyticus]TOI27354.1 hypothetical protein CGI62_24140 [Vibrio parahaemolyticus]
MFQTQPTKLTGEVRQRYLGAVSRKEKEAAQKNDDEKVRTSKRLPHLKRFPYSATGKFVMLADQQV